MNTEAEIGVMYLQAKECWPPSASSHQDSPLELLEGAQP